jgi:Tfp pilus assembly protein PilF
MQKVFVRFTLLLSLFTVVACTSWMARNKEEAVLHLQIGTSSLQNGMYPQALSELLTAEQLDGDNPLIQNNLGLAYYFRERSDLAEIHIRKAISLKNDYTDARNNLSRILTDRGQYKEAYEQARLAGDDLTYTSPEKPQINMGIALFKLGNFKEAKSRFLKALEYQHDNCLANSYYGRSLYELKDFSHAAEALDRAVSFCQKNLYDEPHYYSALTYFQLGQKAKAESRFEELLKLYPGGQYRDKAKEMLDTIRR